MNRSVSALRTLRRSWSVLHPKVRFWSRPLLQQLGAAGTAGIGRVPGSVTGLRVYGTLERPGVEVLVDGRWYDGQARVRTTHEDGRAVYEVQYRMPGSFGNVIGAFHADHVRLGVTQLSPLAGTA